MDPEISMKVVLYMDELEDSNEVHDIQDFLDFVNPETRYQLIKHVYLERMSKLFIFQTSIEMEIMLIARLMKMVMNVVDEEIITQGDEPSHMYIIVKGEVRIMMQESKLEIASGRVFGQIKAKNKFLSKLSSRHKNKDKIPSGI